MRIEDLYENLKQSGGTYIGRTLDDVSRQTIMILQKELGLGQKAVKENDLHTTLMYSYDDIRSDFMTSPKGIVCDTNGASLKWFGKNNDCLVLALESPELSKRHDEIAAYGVKHTYNPYEPHVTLAYDVPNPESIDLSKGVIPARLRFVGEYMDKLDLDWKKGR